MALVHEIEPTILGPTQDSNSSGHRGPSFGCPLSFSVTRKRDKKGRELEGGTNCCLTFSFIYHLEIGLGMMWRVDDFSLSCLV